MIRADTPPGTEVVCLDDAPGKLGPSGLSKGAVYTVKLIAPGIDGGHVVLLHEVSEYTAYSAPHGRVRGGFHLYRFRYLDLPLCLTGLLQKDRVPEDA
jgi:hypothetical protein